MGLDSMIYACAKKKYHDELSVGYEDIISIAEWQYEKNGINDPIEYRADGFSGEVCYCQHGKQHFASSAPHTSNCRCHKS